MFSAAKISGPTGVADPQFNYVTALLHGDGTNGAQNNTFVDSSSNAFTITRNGTPTQGSFSPYGTLWSNYFNGSSLVYFANNTALQLATGDFTLETWIYPTPTNTYFHFFSKWNSATGLEYQLTLNTSTGVLNNNVSGNTMTSASSAVANNTWSHIAWTRNSGTDRLFVNGIQVATTTGGTIINGTSNLCFGGRQDGAYYGTGYLSNARLIKGTALYTSSFTPPTAPLTAITNTQVLTCQSNRFIDNSSNNFIVNITGTPSIQRFNPFLPTLYQAYSTSVYGGSGYFNGSTDYLVTPNNSALYLSTNNFTVELWVYLTSTSSFNIVRGTTTDSFGIVYNSGSFLYYLSSNGSSWNIASGVSMGANSAPLNTWIHVALVRNGNTFTPYINGVAGTTTTSSSAIYQTNGFYLFAEAASGGSGFSYGYSSDFRIVNGSAVYTTNFTPPTAPLTAITNTSLLLSMQNAGIYDNAMIEDWTTYGLTQISTSVKKYGTGSISFNGVNSYMSTPYNPNIVLGSGNFTLEFWFYFNSFGTTPVIVDQYTSGGSGITWQIYLNTSSSHLIFYTTQSGNIITGSSTITTGTWYHYAVVRNSGVTKQYINGVLDGSMTDTSVYNNTVPPLTLGAQLSPGPVDYFNGYIDDFRLTIGYARYTSNFTPPTSAFPNY